MAGVKGRSGGKRAGSGRKKVPIVPLEAVAGQKPLDFLLAVQNDVEADPKLRVRAAIAAAQYCHLKKGDGGIKDAEKEKAKTAASGKFKAAPSPLKLVQR